MILELFDKRIVNVVHYKKCNVRHSLQTSQWKEIIGSINKAQDTCLTVKYFIIYFGYMDAVYEMYC
jgi:hypothetical protein